MMRRAAWAVATAVLLVAGAVPSRGQEGIALAAVYPLSGGQAEGGRDELRGLQMAADLINRDGGVRGRRVRIQAADAPSADAAPAAVRDAVGKSGARIVVGTYGSTMALPAADTANALGTTFWETGAVAEMLTVPGQRHRFRTVGNGSALGRAAVRFTAEVIAGRLQRASSTLRLALLYADDVYGRSVATGHRLEAAAAGMPVVLDRGYDPRRFDAPALMAELLAAHPDVLLSSSYLEDGVTLRRALLANRVPLKALVGTSSGFCLADFGKALEEDAVGLFAADKPDGQIRPEALAPAARSLLTRVRAAYEDAYGTNLSAAALHGFVGGWVLLHEVLPRARTLEPEDVARAALAVDLPPGSLINGSGVWFAPPGAPDAGQNRRAVAVVGQWQAARLMRVVYPPSFAQATPEFIPLPR